MRHLSKSKEKKGLAPGSPVFTGKRKTVSVSSSLFEYDKKDFVRKNISGTEDIEHITSSKKISWIDIVGLHDTNLITKYSDFFKLHPLIKEDLVDVGQRPKMEVYNNCIFVVMKLAYFEHRSKNLSFEQVSFILTGSTIISFQEKEGDIFESVRLRLINSSGKIRDRGVDYLLYSLMDSVVDNYFIIMESMGDRLEELEDKITVDASSKNIQELRNIKHNLIYLRKAIWPIRDIVNGLERDQDDVITAETKLFLRDLYDHSIQLIDFVETFKDLSSSLFDMYNSMINNRMNEIMKVLTVISTIFIPITFITGFYGMNFKFMPELFLKWAYPLVIVLMIAIALFMISYFKRKKWL